MESIKVLDKAFAILELAVMCSPARITLGEFMGKCRLNKTTCARLIRSLVEKGYLEHCGARGGYRAGIRAQSLGNNMHYDPAFFAIAKPACLYAATELQSSVMISTMLNGHRYILIHENRSSVDALDIRGIALAALCNTASGFVLLAHAAEAQVDAVIAYMGYPDSHKMVMEKCFPNIEFRDLLAKIKEDGHTSFVTPFWGVTAFPIFRNGKCFASIGSTLPACEATAEKQDQAIKTLKFMQKSIMEKLER